MCRHYRGKKFMSSRFQLCVTVCLTARPTSYYWKVADSAAGPDGYSPSAYSYKNSQTEKPTYQDGKLVDFEERGDTTSPEVRMRGLPGLD
jgi:hypothetical protein